MTNKHLDAHDVVNLLEGNDLDAGVWDHLGFGDEAICVESSGPILGEACAPCTAWVMEAIRARLRVMSWSSDSQAALPD